MGERLEEKVSERVNQEISLKELEEELKEWFEEEKEELPPPGAQEIETVVFDYGETGSGVLCELHTLTGVYTAPVSESTERIKEILLRGKMARVKMSIAPMRKRVYGIKEVIEVNDDAEVKIPKNKVVKGVLTRLGSAVSIYSNGSRYIIRDGTIGFVILDQLIDRGVEKVVLLISQVEKKVGARMVYNIIRGVYVILPPVRKDQELLKKVEEEFVEVAEVKKEEEVREGETPKSVVV